MDFSKLSTSGAHAQTLDFTKAAVVDNNERIDFAKANPGVTKLRVELYWENQADGDIAAMQLNAEGTATIQDILFFNTPGLALPGLVHSGDVTDAAAADGDPSTPEETITVDLNAVSANTDKIVFVASVHGGKKFGFLEDCRVLIIDDETNEVLYGYELDEDCSTDVVVELASFYRKNGGFRMNNINAGARTLDSEGKRTVKAVDFKSYAESFFA